MYFSLIELNMSPVPEATALTRSVNFNVKNLIMSDVIK